VLTNLPYLALGDRARFQGWTINPNTLGILCGVAIPVFVAAFVNARASLKLLAGACIPLAAVMLLLTGSRGSLIGAAIGTIAVLRTVSATRIAIVPLLVVALVVVGPTATSAYRTGAAPNEPTAATLLGHLDRRGDSGRTEVWPRGWEEMWRHPFTGAGLSTSAARFDRGEFGGFRVFEGGHFHNSYLEAGVELGLGGLLLLGAVGVYGLSLLLWPAHRQDAWAAGLAAGGAAMAMFETGALTPGAVLFIPFWLGLTVVAAGRRAAWFARPERQPAIAA
jgi:O-antigen ligase